MITKKSVKTYLTFSTDEKQLVFRLVREQVGERTIASVLDEYSYVFSYYRGLFSGIEKMGQNCAVFDHEEYNALTNILSKAYNNPETSQTDKNTILDICNAMQEQHDLQVGV